jgi:hypothetical protein
MAIAKAVAESRPPDNRTTAFGFILCELTSRLALGLNLDAWAQVVKFVGLVWLHFVICR